MGRLKPRPEAVNQAIALHKSICCPRKRQRRQFWPPSVGISTYERLGVLAELLHSLISTR